MSDRPLRVDPAERIGAAIPGGRRRRAAPRQSRRPRVARRPRRLFGRLLKLRDAGSARLIWEAALGFLAATSALTIAGLLGVLQRQAIIGVTVVAAAAGVVRLRALFAESSQASDDTAEPPTWAGRALCASCHGGNS